MTRHVVLLRGINLAQRNRISMLELRAMLEGAGFRDVATYVQSGNVVLSSGMSAEDVATSVSRLIKNEFGFDIVVLVRSDRELADIVRRNPLAKVAVDPKRHLVTFLSRELPGELRDRMATVAAPYERLSIVGREIYSWHPPGFGRWPLWDLLVGRFPKDVGATTRNWTTVTALAMMVDD